MIENWLGNALMAWLTLLVVMVVYKMLIGDINLQGLIQDAQGNVSPERLQMLMTTIFAVVVYASESVHSHRLVEPSTVLLSGVSGSQLIYLVGKALRNRQS